MIDFDAALATLLARPAARLIAVDGRPVAGKSTLARRFETAIGAQVLSLDDFVKPEEQWRPPQVPSFPFDYIRYDTFVDAVRTLARREPYRFRPYDWQTGDLSEADREIAPDRPTVVEGVSSLHPALAPLYDIRFWIESDPATVLEASLARGAGPWEDEWRTLFLPSIELYLETKP